MTIYGYQPFEFLGLGSGCDPSGTKNLSHCFNFSLRHIRRRKWNFFHFKTDFQALTSLFLMNRAGLPAHTSLSGISFVTTEEAPTMAFSPIVTGLHMTVLQPIKAFFFIRMIPNEYRRPGEVSLACTNKIQRAVILAPSSIIIFSGLLVSKITPSPIKFVDGSTSATPPI